MKRVTVECLGAFRELGDQIQVEVTGETFGDLRQSLESDLSQQGRTALMSVLARSAFAAGDRMVRDSDDLGDAPIAILPPVAGG